MIKFLILLLKLIKLLNSVMFGEMVFEQIKFKNLIYYFKIIQAYSI